MNPPASGVPPTLASRVFRGVLVVALVVAALLIAWYARKVLLVIFAGVLFGVFLRSLAELLARKTALGERWSLVIVIFAITGLAALGVWQVAPEFSRQMDELSKTLPASIAEVRQTLQDTGWGQWVVDKVSEIDQWVSKGRAMSQAQSLVTSTFAAIAAVLIILAIGIYLAAEPEVYRRGFLSLVPPERRERAGEVLDEVGETLRWWLIGRFAGMAVIGVFTWLGLWLLGVPLTLALALIAAVLTFIPNIGPVLSAIPAALLALLQGPMIVLYVILLYIGIQAVESYILTPLIQRRAVKIPPAMLLSAQLLMGIFAGLIGVALATPLLAAIMVCVRMLYIEDTLKS